jgi:AcrR family transcriptional regulator
MSTDDLSPQRTRTRAALVAAARELLAAGVTPTVEEAAVAASVSRATAYRYFPTQTHLLVGAHPEMAATSMLPANAPDDPVARLDAAVAAFTDMIVATEAQQRATLRLSLDPAHAADLPLRHGRAIGWFREALDGLRPALGDAEVERLVLAVRATTGIEALVWLVDVAGLGAPEAVDLMRRSAHDLVVQAQAQVHAEPDTRGSVAGMVSGRRRRT